MCETMCHPMGNLGVVGVTRTCLCLCYVPPMCLGTGTHLMVVGCIGGILSTRIVACGSKIRIWVRVRVRVRG